MGHATRRARSTIIHREVTERAAQWLRLQKWQHPREVEWYEELRRCATRGDAILPLPPSMRPPAEETSSRDPGWRRWLEQLWCGATCISVRGLEL